MVVLCALKVRIPQLIDNKLDLLEFLGLDLAFREDERLVRLNVRLDVRLEELTVL